jgi:benzoyl-CoA 2,3-dioxygenase component B
MRIRDFTDWKDCFAAWQRDVGIDDIATWVADLPAFEFDVHFAPDHSHEIEFGDWAGSPRWENVLQIPDQRARDALFELIRYQGDTEFASSEQQRFLLQTAPSTADLQSIVRVMREEARHGWQMAYLLITYFGDEGRREALKLLERRSSAMSGTSANRRLLWAFNEPLDNWIDFFYYTELVDRDGKFQLDMLTRSGFGPLAQSTAYMLNEEAYHLKTGHLGLKRILAADVVPRDIMQKYLNKWIPNVLDLFGKDDSSTAAWTYVWGLKSRFSEHNQQRLDRSQLMSLNDMSRNAYYREVEGLMAQLNRVAPDGEPLRLPHPAFHRRIGEHAGKPYSVTGELLSAQQYEQHLSDTLPTDADRERLASIFSSDAAWIQPVSAA